MTHQIYRFPLGCKVPGGPMKYEYRIGDARVEARDLYDAARRFRDLGFSGPAQSYAFNGTPSLAGTIEQLCELAVKERDKSDLRVEKWTPNPFGEVRNG